jgi:hypothetical protein
MQRPGKNHFIALIHVLRYLRDNINLGIHFYSDITRSPVHLMLTKLGHDACHLFFGFSDSSWNDNIDTGRSTGCFLMFYMGGLVDQSSNLPDPVALSSAEAEYNEGCLHTKKKIEILTWAQGTSSNYISCRKYSIAYEYEVRALFVPSLRFSL